MDHDRTSSLILPDSRPKFSRQTKRVTVQGLGTVNLVPIFCANCGKPYGYVPEENMDFVCWLCDPCSDKWGAQYGLAKMPNEVFWSKVQAEMMEKYGRILTDEELRAATETASPLTTLLREGV
jgi:hypothetical protein